MSFELPEFKQNIESIIESNEKGLVEDGYVIFEKLSYEKNPEILIERMSMELAQYLVDNNDNLRPEDNLMLRAALLPFTRELVRTFKEQKDKGK